MARSAGSFTFIQEAAIFIADKKQAAQSAANNCSDWCRYRECRELKV
jgi:hypothetical protein